MRAAAPADRRAVIGRPYCWCCRMVQAGAGAASHRARSADRGRVSLATLVARRPPAQSRAGRRSRREDMVRPAIPTRRRCRCAAIPLGVRRLGPAIRSRSTATSPPLAASQPLARFTSRRTRWAAGAHVLETLSGHAALAATDRPSPAVRCAEPRRAAAAGHSPAWQSWPRCLRGLNARQRHPAPDTASPPRPGPDRIRPRKAPP